MFNFLRKIDIIGPQAFEHIKFQNEDLHKTRLGGIVSLVIKIFVLKVLAVGVYNLVNRGFSYTDTSEMLNDGNEVWNFNDLSQVHV